MGNVLVGENYVSSNCQQIILVLEPLKIHTDPLNINMLINPLKTHTDPLNINMIIHSNTH